MVGELRHVHLLLLLSKVFVHLLAADVAIYLLLRSTVHPHLPPADLDLDSGGIVSVLGGEYLTSPQENVLRTASSASEADVNQQHSAV